MPHLHTHTHTHTHRHIYVHTYTYLYFPISVYLRKSERRFSLIPPKTVISTFYPSRTNTNNGVFFTERHIFYPYDYCSK